MVMSVFILEWLLQGLCWFLFMDGLWRSPFKDAPRGSILVLALCAWMVLRQPHSVCKWRHKRPRMLESDAKKQKYWRNQWVRQHLWREVDRQCFGSGPLCLFPCIGPAYPAEFLQNFGLFAGLRVSTFSPGHPMGLCHTPSVDGTLDISSIRRKPSPSTPTRILHPTLSKSPETNPG